MKTNLIVIALCGLMIMACDKAQKEKEEIKESFKDEAKEIGEEAKEAKEYIGSKLKAKKVEKENVPGVLNNALLKDFPSSEVIEYYTYPEIIEDVHNDTIDLYEVVVPEYYIVTLKQDNVFTKAKYHKSGKLVDSKKPVASEKYPAAINETLKTTEYKDWEIISEKEEVKAVAEKELLYKVIVQKGDQKQIIYFNKEGKIVKVLSIV